MALYQDRLWDKLEKIKDDEPRKPIIDPRPDLAYDSKDWARLLELAEELSQNIAGLLHGFRCGGLRIHRGGQGYALRPDFDTKTSIWANKNQYEVDRDEWLTPWKQEIINLLNRL